MKVDLSIHMCNLAGYDNALAFSGRQEIRPKLPRKEKETDAAGGGSNQVVPPVEYMIYREKRKCGGNEA